MATPQHLARRFARLEQATRYRPVHIQALLLAAIMPSKDSNFLYSAEGAFDGEACQLLDALNIPFVGKSREAVLLEVQKRGLLLVHILECPLEANSLQSTAGLLEKQLGATLVRIRRSLKPKRVILIANELQSFSGKFNETELGCPVSFADLQSGGASGAGLNALQVALAAENAGHA